MKPSFHLSLTTILLLSLTACGGGGGGGKKNPPLQNNNPVSSISSVTQSSSDTSAVSSESSVSSTNTSSAANSSSTNSASSTSTIPGVLSLVSTTPENNAIDIDRTETLSMTFSTAIANTDSINYVTLKSNTGADAPFEASISDMTLWITPTEKLSLLTPYQVSVNTDIRGSSDEQLAAAATLDFTTRDGIWGDALSISTHANANADASKPKIATDANGNAIALWQQINVSKTDIVVATYTEANGWSNATVIGSDIDENSGDIAMNDSGQAIATWVDNGTVKARIYSFEDGIGTWGTLLPLEEEPEEGEENVVNSTAPETAIDAQGNAFVIWKKGTSLLANRFSDTGWDTAVQLDTISTNPFPKLVVDSTGNLLAVWNNGNELFSSRYTAGNEWSTGWSTPVPVENETGTITSVSQLSINASGDVALIWINASDAVSNIYSVTSGWGTPAIVNTNTVKAATNATIGWDNNGNAIAVWLQDDNQNVKRLWHSRYSPETSTWSTAETIETNLGDASMPQLTIDEGGNAMVIWRQRVSDDDSERNLYSSRYVMGGTWSEPTLMEAESRDVGDLEIAINKFGDVFAVWNQERINEAFSIWVNIFE